MMRFRASSPETIRLAVAERLNGAPQFLFQFVKLARRRHRQRLAGILPLALDLDLEDRLPGPVHGPGPPGADRPLAADDLHDVVMLESGQRLC